jgi:putative aminophosphonate oxidoreductase
VVRSWWLREALGDEAQARPLEGALRADVCIVGGGYTGLWTALRIAELEPGCDVVLVEADVCGGGASGRNGGFALTFWHHFLALERACGTEEALRLGRASADAVESIGAFCGANGIDAGYRKDGWLWTATNRAQVGAWAGTVAALERHGERPFLPVPDGEVPERAGSPRHLAAVFEPTAATLQPALLARGLRRVAIERGIRIFENSPMVELERGATPVVRVASGSVRADRVVVAMNAWSAGVGGLRRAFVTVSSDIVLTASAPERLGLRDGVGVSDSRLMVHYCRATPDGRLAFGRGGGALGFGRRVGAAFDGASPRAAWVHASLRSLYPALDGVPLAASWTGPIDRSFDGLPFFTLLGRPDILCGAGFSGNGVGPSVLAGRILASMALGRHDEWSGSGLVRRPPDGLPPEPVRYLGGRIVRAAVARKERAEDDGREPSRLARRLARLAPAGLVPVD